MTVLERRSFTYRFIAGLHAELGARGFIVYFATVKNTIPDSQHHKDISFVTDLSVCKHHKDISFVTDLSVCKHHKDISFVTDLSVCKHHKDISFVTDLSVCKHHKANSYTLFQADNTSLIPSNDI